MALKLINKQSIETLVRLLMEGYAKIDHVHAAATATVAGFLSASDKKKIDGVEAGANKTTVDTSLSSTSFNPVQNKAVKAALDAKSDASHSHAWGAITGKPAAFAPSAHAHDAATQSAAGFMAAADKKKLDGVATGANAYVHPSHAAKASGLYKITVDAAGHVSAAAAVAKADITALGIPAQDTNTVYAHPTTSGNRHVPAGGASGQILRWSADGTASWGADNNTTYGAMGGASASAAGKAGLVPAPAAGKQATFLRGDGVWASPSNTTYSLATQSTNGLMSAADKKKLDNVFPIGRAIFSYVDLNPAALYGGTWTVRTDTYMFMGMRIYRRTA